jgi:hypothetical protein
MQGTLQKRQGIQQHGIVAHFSGVVNEFFHQMLRNALTTKGIFHIKPFQFTFRIRKGAQGNAAGNGIIHQRQIQSAFGHPVFFL